MSLAEAPGRLFMVLGAVRSETESGTSAPKGGVQGHCIWNTKPKLLSTSSPVFLESSLTPQVKLAAFLVSLSHLAIMCEKFAEL